MVRINSFGRWLRQKFGSPVFKLSIDGGFTCPNRDGSVAWGGCTYCNNDSFRPESAGPVEPIETQIESGIDYLSERFKARRFLVYWQSFTNTYAPVNELKKLYLQAFDADPRIVGMTVGTRPDCVEEEKLEMLEELARDRYVCMEYGLESIFDETLSKVNRGHDSSCYLDAVLRTRRRGLDICSHVILGLPGETREQLMEYAPVLNELGVQFVKLHHLHLVKGTRMAKEFAAHPFPLFEFEDWVTFICSFLEELDPAIVVQRLFGWTPVQHLVGPHWRKNKPEIYRAILHELESRDSWQGKALGAAPPGSIESATGTE
jgi:radical SAM protein (TIGR01212 family)